MKPDKATCAASIKILDKKREETTIDLTIGQWKNTHHPTPKTPGYLRQNQQRERNDVHRPNRRVSRHFQKGK